MANVNLKPASKGLFHHHYSPSTVVSMDFGHLQCDQIIECVKRDEWRKIKADGIMYIAPQQFPPFGKAFVKTAAFFVPEFELIEASDSFHSNMRSYRGVTTKCPIFNSDKLNEILANSSYTTVVASTLTPDAAFFTTYPTSTFDFVHVTDQSGSPLYTFYKLNRKGALIYKLFKSLGYDFSSFKYASNISFSDAFASGRTIVNALPFLAYLKVYCDYFANGVYYNFLPQVALIKAVHDGRDFSYGGNSWYDSSTGYLTPEALIFCAVSVLMPHERNMYTEAWNTPTSPNSTSLINNMISTNPTGSVSPYFFRVDSNGTIVSHENGAQSGNTAVVMRQLQNGVQSSLSSISSFGLRLLTAFDRYVRRNGLSGSKSVQQVYSRFGLKGEDFDCFYVHKIFEKSDRLKFMPVLSNSDTVNGANGKGLGAFAGYGSSALHFEFDYRCKDFGYIVVVSWLNVAPIYIHGMDPKTLRYSPFDFFTPEYDGQTVRGIPACEVSINKKCTGIVDKGVFGFTNLYDDYRELRDNVAGDFISEFAKDFIFARDLSVIRQESSTFQAQDGDVQYWDSLNPSPDMSDPFQMKSSLGDRFWLTLEFDIDAMRPVMSRSDSFDLGGSGEVDVPVNGNLMG